jgi:hypothetical protein
LHLRHPWWAVEGLRVRINGREEPIQSRPGQFAAIKRTWASGDLVEAELPMSLRAEAFRDNPRRLALLYGPLVLAATTEPGHRTAAIVADPGRVLGLVKPVSGRPQAFTAPATVFRRSFEPVQADVLFTPFCREFDRPTIVYWDMCTEEQWTAKLNEHKVELARQEALNARTIDVLEFHAASERAHHMKGENTQSGEFRGRRWRHAVRGGWFSVEMKVASNGPVELLATYWGSDAGHREFDILVDNTRVATEKLQHNRPGVFYDATYPVPVELTRGKKNVTVRFQALPGRTAGGVFEVRALRRAP